MSYSCYDFQIQVKSWLEIMQSLCASERMDIRTRGVHIVMSLVESSKDNATAVVETNLLEILMAFAKDETSAMNGGQSRAESAFQRAAELGLIKPAK